VAPVGGVECNNAAAQRPQDPYHLVFDPTLGLLTPDGNRQELGRIATCSIATTGTDFTNHNFDRPRGIGLGPTGEIYVSDEGADEIVRVDRGNGAVSVFEARIQQPYGVEWLATGRPRTRARSWWRRAIASSSRPRAWGHSPRRTCATPRSTSRSSPARCSC